MPTYTVKPAGGGDYASLQLAENAIDDIEDAYILDCYRGGSLGRSQWSAGWPESTVLVRAAAGEGHNGDITGGAYVVNETGSGDCFIYQDDLASFIVDGIRCSLTNGAGQTGIGFNIQPNESTCDFIAIRRCIVTHNASTNAGTGINVSPSGVTITLVELSNNLVAVIAGAAGTGIGASVLSFSGTVEVTSVIYNNTISGTANGVSISRYAFGGTANHTSTIRNNIANCTTGSSYLTSNNTGTGTLSITASNNASDDGTASSAWGGSGHVTGITTAIFTDEPNDDYSLAFGTNAVVDVGFNLAGTIDDDIIAFARPYNSTYDMGAFERGAAPTPPVAAFSGTPLSGQAPLTVQFTDASTNTPTGWAWDFGDDGTSAEQNPEYVFEAAGTYTVSLTASNGGGSDDEVKVGYITVTAPPATGGVERARTRGRTSAI